MVTPEEDGPNRDPGGAEGVTGVTLEASENGLDPKVNGSSSTDNGPKDQPPLLHLDLFNFDRPEAEGSRYVLTSPRSLEACARCMVKPVELLPRCLNDLVREAPGRSMRVATGLFEVYEIDRQKKLQLCREERDRIIREEKRRILTPMANSVPSSPAPKICFKTTSSGKEGQPKTKSHSLDSLPKRKNGASSKTSSDSGASSTLSIESTTDRWPKASPRAKTLATMHSLVGRSFSLGDLSHSPQTTKKVETIVKEFKKRGLKEVPDKDKRIAALMIAKHQEENILNEQKYMAHLQWDHQRRRAEIRKEEEEREKQRALLQGQRMWESQVETRKSKLTKEQKEAAALKHSQSLIMEEKWREQAERQERERREKLERAKLEEKHKKVHQQHNLKTKEEYRKEALERVEHLVLRRMTSAEQKKVEQELQRQSEIKLMNKALKLKHEALFQEITKQEEAESEVLKRSLDGNLGKAQENFERLMERRNQELRERARKEELQIHRARLAAEKKEREQRERLEALAKAGEEKLHLAAQVAEEVAQQKARRAVQSRLEKEKAQKANKEKVEQYEDRRRRELLQSIERKLERTENIFKEKKTYLDNARSIARASFHIREKVREETNTRTFDKMALEAELRASMDKK
ncbi:coiled-coil domain-containing protein 177 [Ambystoma mexicanum]|uniref:coiled-coil domain-containing protein 177 n=1 Tax=Ambystoma mexicanum TaxID=8296 RepID=UPI0037E7CA0F